MEILNKITVVVLCLITWNVNSQTFYKKYTAGSFAEGNDIIQLADSSYAVTGTGGGFDDASGQAFLMMIDSLGNMQWAKQYGGEGDEVGMKVMHIPGDGFYIAGYTSTTPQLDFDFWLMKTDEQGILEWQHNYGSENWDVLHDAVLMDDGIVMVGQTEGVTSEGKDIYMVKTDLAGDTIWTKTIATPEEDIAYAVTDISANEFVIGGVKGVNGTPQGMIASFDADGNENWTTILDDEGRTMVRNLIVYDNYIYTFGQIYNTDETIYNGWYARSEMDGTYVEKLNFTYSADNYVPSMAFKDDGKLYLAVEGSIPELDPYENGLDVQVVVYHAEMWYEGPSYNFSNFNDDFINKMMQSIDGGVTLVGTVADIRTEVSQGTCIMIAKIGPNGENPYIVDSQVEVFDMLGVEEENVQVTLHLYPNPTTQYVEIPSKVQGLEYQLVNLQGTIVSTGELENQLSVEQLTNGMYILKVTDQHKMWTAKILKQ